MRPRIPLAFATLMLLNAPLLAAGDANVASLEAEAAAVDRQAQAGGGAVEGRISASFTQWAGSADNAEALTSGLREGTPVNLMSTAPDGSLAITGFTPATGPMGYGNVRISLALAQEQLAGLGISQPTPDQLVAALNGGTITYVGPDGALTTTTLRGVLEMRASGMGWGEIAQAYGTKLGPVISGLKTTHAPATSAAAIRTTTTAGPTAATGAQGMAKGRSGDGGKSPASSGGHAYGKGIVSAYGVGADGVASAKPGKGQGYGANAKAGGPVATAGGAGLDAGTAGLSTAHGNGNAYGQGKAHGKP